MSNHFLPFSLTLSLSLSLSLQPADCCRLSFRLGSSCCYVTNYSDECSKMAHDSYFILQERGDMSGKNVCVCVCVSVYPVHLQCSFCLCPNFVFTFPCAEQHFCGFPANFHQIVYFFTLKYSSYSLT